MICIGISDRIQPEGHEHLDRARRQNRDRKHTKSELTDGTPCADRQMSRKRVSQFL